MESLVFLVGFLVLQLAYSFRLKQLVGLDVLTIAALFTIRAAAGQSGYELGEGARGFAFNAKFESLVKFLEIGTVAADR